MRTFYRSHTIEVNKQPNGQVAFDVFSRGQYVLAGFSQEGGEPEFVDLMKSRVDKILSEAPVQFRV